MDVSSWGGCNMGIRQLPVWVAILCIVGLSPEVSHAKKAIFGAWGGSAGVKAHGVTDSLGSQSTGPVLTGQDLRQCIKKRKELERLEEELDRNEKNLNRLEAEAFQLNDKINNTRPTVDRYDQNAVNNFNEMIYEHRSVGKSLHSKTQEYNSKILQHRETAHAYNTKCTGRPYDENEAWMIEQKLRN